MPGGTAAAASERYDAIRGEGPRVVYHGRVVREGRWVVLHYMFFYAMNDWRSTFEGANDHEADLEQCFVVCEALDDGSIEPAWFCAAAHDEKGDDLRRRWDDPRMQTIDGHPVVYPGAGSHATYLERGEYIMLLPFPGERNIRGPLDLVRRIWRDTLAQPDPGDLAREGEAGAERPVRRLRPWRRPVRRPGRRHRLDADRHRRRDGWVDRYRGLWGLDTGDRFAGERAPAGPKYTRTGTVRQSWHDPLGFAGLDKVAPPSQAVAVLEARIAELTPSGPRSLPTRPRSSPRRCPRSTRSWAPSARRPGWTATGRDWSPSCARARSGWPSLRRRDVELATAIDAGRGRLAALRAGVPRRPARPSPPCVGAGAARRSPQPGASARPGPRSASGSSSWRWRSSSGSGSCRRCS